MALAVWLGPDLFGFRAGPNGVAAIAYPAAACASQFLPVFGTVPLRGFLQAQACLSCWSEVVSSEVLARAAETMGKGRLSPRNGASQAQRPNRSRPDNSKKVRNQNLINPSRGEARVAPAGRIAAAAKRGPRAPGTVAPGAAPKDPAGA